MSEEELIGNNLKSFGEELFRNIIINSARKAMLDNIEALSKKNLQKELKEHLQKEFELEDKIKKQKEVIDKIKEYCKSKIEEQKNMTDFSKYYLENYDKAINTQHLSHSGVMLETIKSTTIKRYEDILELLEEIE